jgi:uncharacterized protein (TIGR02246 family)
MVLREELQSLMDAYGAAYQARDAKGCAKAYEDGATILSPWGPPVTGRMEIVALHRKWFQEPDENKSLEVLDAGSDGDLAYCMVADSTDLRQADGTAAKERGNTLSILARNADGQWRIRYSSLTPDD